MTFTYAIRHANVWLAGSITRHIPKVPSQLNVAVLLRDAIPDGKTEETAQF